MVPRADEARVRVVEDRPEVTEAIFNGCPRERDRVRAGIVRRYCDVSFAGFLIACASSRITRAHSSAAMASTSRTAVP